MGRDKDHLLSKPVNYNQDSVNIKFTNNRLGFSSFSFSFLFSFRFIFLFLEHRVRASEGHESQDT